MAEVDALFDGWERAWSGRDLAAFAPLCDREVRYEDPLTDAPLAGSAAIAAHAKALWEAFPDARLNTVGARLHDDRYACAPFRLLGTHRGRLGRLSPTGRELVLYVLVYAELRDGRLLRIRAFFDAYGAAMDLGLLPRPGTPGERALLLLRGFGLRR